MRFFVSAKHMHHMNKGLLIQISCNHRLKLDVKDPFISQALMNIYNLPPAPIL